MSQSTTINALLHLIIGILFGAGLAISEMANPNAVLSFLDISAIFKQDSIYNSRGVWNPGLIFVMLAAIFVGFVAYAIKNKMPKPKFDKVWRLPSKLAVDKRLLIGASLFGIGWGLAGYCPGPAITAVVNNPIEALYFIASMLLGSFLFQLMPAAR